MKHLTKEDIAKINENCPEDQGIFLQPSMIPVSIKELVIYGRYRTCETTGGSCWGGELHGETFGVPANWFQVLDMVLEKLSPEITYLQYKKIAKLIHSNDETEYEYYGNSTEWKVEYIILSELEKFLNEL